MNLPYLTEVRIDHIVKIGIIISSPEPKAHWWAYRIGRPPSSSGYPTVCRPHSLNIFSSETTEPIEAKFHMESPWDWGTKVCSNGSGHLIKMAVMPIYGKNLKKIFFSGTKKPMTLKLNMQYWALKYYQVCSNDDPGLTLIYFTARSNLIPYAFVWEKGKTMDISETTVVYDLKPATENQSDKKSPGGCMPPAPELYTCVKSWKHLYKIRLQRDFFETCNKWVKW